MENNKLITDLMETLTKHNINKDSIKINRHTSPGTITIIIDGLLPTIKEK
jgi:hypothetical protein